MLTMELAKAARRTLGSSYTVSIRPDFPHLITAPDILVGGEGRLVGFFVPHESEAQDATGLLVRLTLCRLGLPGHLKCVLVDRSHARRLGILDEDGWGEVQRHFDGFIQKGELDHALDDQLLHMGEPARVSPAFAATRQRCAQRYASLMNVSLAHYKLHASQKSPANLLSGLRQKFGYGHFLNRPWTLAGRSSEPDMLRNAKARPNVVQKNDRVVGYDAFEKQAHPVHALRFFVDVGVQYDYVLKDGIPEFRRPATKVLACHRLPLGKRDPLQLLRAAAFAGWAMAAVSTPAQAEAILQDLDSTLT